ncbi:hypothetical protein [Dyadobacter sp. CY312]|uniref:hypothetical protein n=1 Tax=Dyadobacter sp. CY312 TaxID=2907303 RepID=UPI001F24727B|nr:hypothetical protein [Dyadobacter sp. CY312]MCE7044607.1 hypothetical protein [Dyadobacter sp. CY312]
MKRIVRILVFSGLCGFLWECKKNDIHPDNTNPFEKWKLHGETVGRSGAGFSWKLSTDNQTDGHFDLAGNRLFYLNKSIDHIREITLTITKLDGRVVDPTFRIYGRFQQCLIMSHPTISSGTFKASGIFQEDDILNSSQYSGMTWTPVLAKSTVGSKETYKCKVYFDEKDSLCTEGFVKVDMISPADIKSVGSYPDGDYLYFIKKK